MVLHRGINAGTRVPRVHHPRLHHNTELAAGASVLDRGGACIERPRLASPVPRALHVLRAPQARSNQAAAQPRAAPRAPRRTRGGARRQVGAERSPGPRLHPACPKPSRRTRRGRWQHPQPPGKGLARREPTPHGADRTTREPSRAPHPECSAAKIDQKSDLGGRNRPTPTRTPAIRLPPHPPPATRARPPGQPCSRNRRRASP